MKRKEGISLLVIGALMAAILAAGAAGASTPGSQVDPLLSLEWIKNTFIPRTVTQAEEHMAQELSHPQSSVQELSREFRLKRGDVLTLETGSGLICLAGNLDANTSSGAVVDITTGTELEKGETSLTLNHRYLAAENTRATFIVTSDTAVVRLTGPYQLTASDQLDYNALADALKTLGLFRGSDVPYGSGYELENAPTRIQGLIMFLRLIGEENAALTWPGGDYTFPDVPDWALAYVGYAYDKGYTKGYGVNEQNQVIFGTTDLLGAKDYMTFLLRALGYSEGTDFNWLTAIPDARTMGVLTDGEVALLAEKPFLRAQVVYLSYYALSARIAGGTTTLANRLVTAGIFKETTFASTEKALNSQRL